MIGKSIGKIIGKDIVRYVGKVRLGANVVTFQIDYNDGTVRSSAEIDAILAELASPAGLAYLATLTFPIIDLTGNDPRTQPDSDADFNTLIAAGVQIDVDPVSTNEPEVDTYIDGLVTPLSSGQINLLNTLVADLKVVTGNSALSDDFDYIKIYAGETEESALKNLVKDAHHSTAVNNPTFTALEGYTGGSPTYLNSNYNPSTEGVNVAQNSHCFLVYVRTTRAAAGKYIMGVSGSGLDPLIMNVLSATGTQQTYSINGAVSTFVSGEDAKGFTAINRTLSASFLTYKNKTSFNKNATSGSFPSLDILELCRSFDGTPSGHDDVQLAISIGGRAVSSTEMEAIQDVIEVYMDANEKGVIT